MHFCDVMTFDHTLTKYILADPTKTRFVFPTSVMVLLPGDTALYN